MIVTSKDLLENLEGNDIYLFVNYLGVRVTLILCASRHTRYYSLYINKVLVCSRVRFDNALRIAARHLSTILS